MLPQNYSTPHESVQTAAPRLTPSAVNDLLCPKKYRRLRIERRWPKRDAALPVAHGKAVHAVLQTLYAARVGGEVELSNLEAMARGAVRNTWYPRDCDKEEQVGRVMAAVNGFIASDDYEDIEGILDLEREGQFEVRMGGRVLCVMSATLDCALVRASQPDTLVIKERKTTAQRIDLKECYIQMRVAWKMYPKFSKIVIEYDWLDEDNRVARDTITMREVKGQHQIVLSMAYRVLTATEFPSIPCEAACRFCPSRDECATLPADDMSEEQLRRFADAVIEEQGIQDDQINVEGLDQ